MHWEKIFARIALTSAVQLDAVLER